MPTTEDDVTDAAAADAAETLMKCFVCYEVSASCLSHFVYYTRRVAVAAAAKCKKQIWKAVRLVKCHMLMQLSQEGQ